MPILRFKNETPETVDLVVPEVLKSDLTDTKGGRFFKDAAIPAARRYLLTILSAGDLGDLLTRAELEKLRDDADAAATAIPIGR